ncbi:unnamed protein product [Blepharisma stoltei]|uniref:Cyclic nucleotide-binding domain-containing protein n=1 Tax=Blepharisma stoltei TaxID=1481888 RepID=A0AAU9K268_9CILI|nr:unnamed protein product [Blepharisma stoltei]
MSRDRIIFGFDPQNLKLNEEISDFNSYSALKLLFLPTGKFLKIWSWIIFLLIIIWILIIPISIAFIYEDAWTWFSIDFSIDLIFMIDIFINFNSGYYKSYKNLIVKKSTIAAHYLSTWFLFDFINCIPWSILYIINITNSQSFRIPILMKVIRIIKPRELKKKYNYSPLWNFAKFICCIILFIHTIACGWYFLGMIEKMDHRNWLNRYSISHEKIYKKYLISLYWTFVTLTTVGYGDFVPLTNTEKIYAMFVITFGAGFWAFTIGSLISIIKQHENNYSGLNIKLACFSELCTLINLPKGSKAKAKSYMKEYYTKNLQNWAYPGILLRDLAPKLIRELNHHIYKRLIQNIEFFQSRPNSFISYIAPKLSLINFKAKEIIYKMWDSADEMYFLSQGRINYIIKNGTSFRSLSQGTYFGEIEILENIPRWFGVIVVSKIAEIFLLSKLEFSKMLQEFPEIEDEVIKISNKRKQKYQEDIDRVKSLVTAETKLEEDSDEISNIANENLELDTIEALPEESEINYILNRLDTSTYVSLTTDSYEKKRNRSLWSKALTGDPKGWVYAKAKKLKILLNKKLISW